MSAVQLIGSCAEADLLSKSKLCIPLYLERVSAGFPSPAQDYVEQSLDLNQLCISHPAATFFVRVQGDSMRDAGIFPNDVLVVDRALEAKHGDIIIASMNGEMTVKELNTYPRPCLVPRNSAYPVMLITEGSDFEVFGVVTNVVRQMRR
ncbi:MAG: UV protection and mutation protein [Oceanospirillales bacterium]|nr:MAG: UV protection and mutation protein [Oceanospirillales bacterium]